MHHFKDEKAIESSEAKLLIHIRNFTKIFKASLRNKTMKGLYFPYHNFELTFPPNPSPPPPRLVPPMCCHIPHPNINHRREISLHPLSLWNQSLPNKVEHQRTFSK